VTKLGPHTLNGSPQASAWLRAGAPIIKMVGDFSFAAEAAALSHRPLVIGRIVETHLDPNRLISQDPIQTARDYIATYLERPITLNPAVTHWEGPNECVVTEPPAMRWYSIFLNEFARVVWTQFKKTPVIGGWAVGNPNYPLWAEYRPALEATRMYGAILSRHSYAGPDKSTWGYLLLRHREDNAIFSSMGYPDAPLLITEAGADGVPFGNPPGRCWRDLYGDDATRYCDEILFPFDEELKKDPYVLGAVVFTSGGSDTWPDHNIDGRVSELLIANTRPEETPPPPENDPMPDDILSLLPHDTVVVTVPIDTESLPGFIIIQLVKAAPVQAPRHNFADSTPPRKNQDVLNLFQRVFGLDYWAVVTRAGLSSLAGDRQAVYSGADVESLDLSESAKSRIIAAL